MDPQDVPASTEQEWTPLPRFDIPQRARLVVQYTENDEVIHAALTGWALLAQSWVLFEEDEQGQWVAWPQDKVINVEWLYVP